MDTSFLTYCLSLSIRSNSRKVSPISFGGLGPSLVGMGSPARECVVGHGKERQALALCFFCFLRLGFTSFPGPVAHIGYFREEFVTRRAWLTEQGYADLVALGPNGG